MLISYNCYDSVLSKTTYLLSWITAVKHDARVQFTCIYILKGNLGLLQKL